MLYHESARRIIFKVAYKIYNSTVNINKISDLFLHPCRQRGSKQHLLFVMLKVKHMVLGNEIP